jgi:import inner membrane translocase subunit TIM16
MKVEEAERILNVSGSDLEAINKSFERLYEANSPEKGNSFYLQSKVFRARETLIAHLEANNPDADLDPPRDPPNVSSKQ